MKKSILFVMLALFISACSLSSEEKITLPYQSDFSSTKGWSLSAGAEHDTKEKAVKLTKSGATWLTSSRLVSEFKLPIEPNKTYTISFKSKTDIWPPPSLEVFGTYYAKKDRISNSLGTMTANSKIDTWEESTVYIDVPNNLEIKYYVIRILSLPKNGKDGNIWIKDVSFKEGFHTTENSPQKKGFDGSVTRIDKLGNIEIFKNGKFEPFFPIGIYTDDKRKDWSLYKKQGFNIAMWTDGARAIQKAKDGGLYSSMQIVQYMIPVDEGWIPQQESKKIAHLKRTLQEIKDRGLSNDLLFYYVDNEFYHIKDEFTKIIDIVVDQDIDKNGKRMHPIYMLSGTYGLARKYNKQIDFTGTYVAEDRLETDRTNAIVTLNETQNQTQPAIIAQINRGVDNNFRPILFGAIAKGARGMAFWRDGGSAGNIQNQSWWSELPTIAKEIEQMMPLIRADHKTSWSATSDNKKLIFGTRTVDGVGYLIIANPTRSEKEVTFTLNDLPYKVSEIKNYFTKKIDGKVKDNKITITVAPQNSKVVKLVK